MCDIIKIFEVKKGVINAGDVNGLTVVNLKECDAILVPEGSEKLIDFIDPVNFIGPPREIKGKVRDALFELTK